MTFDHAYTCVTQTSIQIQNISTAPEISPIPVDPCSHPTAQRQQSSAAQSPEATTAIFSTKG